MDEITVDIKFVGTISFFDKRYAFMVEVGGFYLTDKEIAALERYSQ